MIKIFMILVLQHVKLLKLKKIAEKFNKETVSSIYPKALFYSGRSFHY
jgi:hypothetical protein